MTTFTGFPTDTAARATLYREYMAAASRAGRLKPEARLERDGHILVANALQGSETSVSLDLSSLNPVMQGVGTRNKRFLTSLTIFLWNLSRELDNASCLRSLASTIATEYSIDLAAQGVH